MLEPMQSQVRQLGKHQRTRRQAHRWVLPWDTGRAEPDSDSLA